MPRARESLLLAALALAACGGPRDERTDSRAGRADSGAENAVPDSVAEFLLAAAATDFHDHGPEGPLRVRDVRVGLRDAPEGEGRYVLCGEFRPAQEDGGWTPFATIRTSDYEQWIGAQSAGFCQDSTVVWDDGGDRSASLQGRLDSLR